MVRVILPPAGVAAVFLLASAVVGQTPQLTIAFPGSYIIPISAEVLWEYPAETPTPIEAIEESALTSFDPPPPQDSSRLKPTPQPAKEKTESPTSCLEEVEEFPDFCFLPFAAPPPPSCSGHKCRRRHKDRDSGGYGNPYLDWPCAMGGCFGAFYPPPYQSACSGRKCHHKHKATPGGQGYPGYGCQGFAGYSGVWGMEYGGFADGCFDGFCPPPYPPPPSRASGHKWHRKHDCSNQGYGYGSWAYPVPGWSVMDDGFNGFTDPNCLPGKHCHGLFHRCHSHKQGPPPYPYPYGFPAQPCLGMECSYPD